MNAVKVGIIGCGGIISKHLEALKKRADVEIISFCDLVESNAEKARELYGSAESKIFSDYRKLLAEPALDAVYVLTPNKTHCEISIAAMRAGKHVMCEKPMAKTAGDAAEMVRVAKETGKLLNIGYQNRFRPDAQFCKKVCEAGELGEIYFAKAHAIRRRAVPTWGVFLDEEAQGGGPLIDIGTHALDLTLWLMDNYEPACVMGSAFHKLAGQRNTGNAFGDWDPAKFTVEDSAFGFIRMKNGATILLESSWALNTLEVGEAKCTLCGTEGGLDMKEGVRINRIHHNYQCVEIPNLEAGGVDFYGAEKLLPADLEQKTFIEAIRDGKELVVKPEQALVVSQILQAVYESDKSGRPVYFA